jgi:manganese efflux pump family protein
LIVTHRMEISLFWSFLLALGLCFDTFAVSVSSGIICNRITFRQACRFSIVMAAFQGAMPLIGWLAGKGVHQYIETFDHWVAAGLLVAVAIKMIAGAFHTDEEKKINPLKIRTMITLGVATSIDALAVGFSFAFVSSEIFWTIVLIGVVTFFAAMLGLLIGKRSAGKFGKYLEITGGILLIAIAAKILMMHL